jgi:hypothetical protein
MNTKTPNKIIPKIDELCKMIVPYPEFNLQYVEVKTESYAIRLECFENVKEKVRRDGGGIQYGWTIWEWQHIMVEAEFHAIWVDLQGNFIDITPKDNNEKRILFLVDNSIIPTGIIIDNVRLNISNDNSVINLIKINEKLTEALNNDDINSIQNLTFIKAELLQTINKLNIKLGRNDICDCGSGKKYKNCCGKD